MNLFLFLSLIDQLALNIANKGYWSRASSGLWSQ